MTTVPFGAVLLALFGLGPVAAPAMPAAAQSSPVVDRFWTAVAGQDSSAVLALVTPSAKVFEYHRGLEAFTEMDWFEFPIEYLEEVWGFPESRIDVEVVDVLASGPFVTRRERVHFVGASGRAQISARTTSYLVRADRIDRIWFFPEEPAGAPILPIEPRYPVGSGPRVLVDAAHDNLHKADGSFSAFTELARADGLVVESLVEPPTRDLLSDADLVVVANALTELTEAEEGALVEWVGDGGALLLVSDHPPYANASASLARRFQFEPFLGRAIEEPRALPDLFSAAAGTLAFPEGDAPEGDVVATMTGHAFRAPDAAIPLLVLKGDWVGRAEGTSATMDLEGWLQGAALPFGSGRVVFLSEARVLSNLSLYDNAGFALSLIRWLTPGPAG